MLNEENTTSNTNEKKHNIPIEHFDFKYVETCNNIKELEKIYKVLLSGIEGSYPDLERAVEKKIKQINPLSHVLRKDVPVLKKDAMPKAEMANLDSEINEFLKSIPDLEKEILKNNLEYDGSLEAESSLPPVRSGHEPIVVSGSSEEKSKIGVTEAKSTGSKSKKTSKPRDYREWEKLEKEFETELNKPDDEDKDSKLENMTQANKVDENVTYSKNKLFKSLPSKIDTKADSMDENSKAIKAEQEKVKGNEAFNAKSYDEAVIYYTRSLQLVDNAASHNNRALAYLKMEKWDKVIDDCVSVFRFEPDNVKALLRRSTAYFSKKLFSQAKEDIDRVLNMEPSNAKASELNVKIVAALEADKVERKSVESKGGKRMVIEETDGESDNDEREQDNQAEASLDELSKKSQAISIEEVDDDSEDDEKESKQNDIKMFNAPSEAKVVIDENDAIRNMEISSHAPQQSPDSIQPVELPTDVIKQRDNAFKLYQSGQYGDSIDVYTKAIDLLANKNADKCSSYAIELGTLYESRAMCKEKIGDYKEAIKDLNLSLGHNDQNVKALQMKAYLYELLEKYNESLVEYERLMRLDSTLKQAQDGYNRVKAIMQNSTKKSMNFDDYKLKGNDYVKLNDYENAADCYTKCIDMDNMNAIGYLNRALCYLKLNKFKQALNDCNFVLHYDNSENIKALYRRALAFKGLVDYDNALRDLAEILRIEPKNDIALRERQELRKMSAEKKPKTVVESTRIETKNVIKPDGLEQAALADVKAEQKPHMQQTSNQQQSSMEPAAAAAKKKFHKVNLPNAITNSYEFLQAWNSINPYDIETHCELIEKIEPKHLPKHIGSKLDNEMFERLVKTFHRYLYDVDECDNNDYQIIYNRKLDKLSICTYLAELRHAQRFDIIKLFLNGPSKTLLKTIFDYFDGHQPHVKKADLDDLKKAYGF